ncbi:MAG: SHOCT domain-containing protein [Adhaeribacter sp.]
MENDFSAIRSLQELKGLLDAGAITQQEFEALKKKIIFGPAGETPAAPLPGDYRNRQPEALGGDPVVPEYSNEEYVGFDNTTTGRRSYDPDALGPEGVREEAELAEPKQRDMLVTILITLGVLLLIGLVAYQLMSGQDSEKLTSTSGPETETVEEVTAEEPAAETTPALTDTASLPVPAAAPEAGAAPAAGIPEAGTAPAAAPALSEEEVISRAKDRLESYYDDMRNPPFSAQRHFAPAVERYYTLINTNPAAINENIATYHFPEFQDSEASIEEGSIKVSPAANGYEVSYIELGSALRKSKNQKQQTKARVRARFDPDFKMTYFRQEALLENSFVE